MQARRRSAKLDRAAYSIREDEDKAAKSGLRRMLDE